MQLCSFFCPTTVNSLTPERLIERLIAGFVFKINCEVQSNFSYLSWIDHFVWVVWWWRTFLVSFATIVNSTRRGWWSRQNNRNTCVLANRIGHSSWVPAFRGTLHNFAGQKIDRKDWIYAQTGRWVIFGLWLVHSVHLYVHECKQVAPTVGVRSQSMMIPMVSCCIRSPQAQTLTNHLAGLEPLSHWLSTSN